METVADNMDATVSDSISTWSQLSVAEGVTTILAMNIVFMTSFWLVGLAFLYVDLYQKPKWMLKYKIQPGKNQPVNRKELKKLLSQLTVNYLLVGLPYAFLHYVLHKLRGSDLTFTLPTVYEFITHFVICVLMEEITFYYSHRFHTIERYWYVSIQCPGKHIELQLYSMLRNYTISRTSKLARKIIKWRAERLQYSIRLLHTSVLYKRYHKVHHEWTAPIGLGAVYAHPVEFAFGNIMTIASGPLVTGACQVTTFTWIGVATAVTIIHHSGYHLPLLPSPEFHDYHHLKFTGNYGLLGILDRLHNTLNPNFLKSKQYKRHRVIFSASEMRMK